MSLKKCWISSSLENSFRGTEKLETDFAPQLILKRHLKIWTFHKHIFQYPPTLQKKCSKTASFFNSTNGGAFRFCLAWLFGLTRIFAALKWLIFILRSHVRGKMCATQYRNWVNCYWKNFMFMSFDGAIGFQNQEDWYTTWNDGRENLWIAWTLIIHVWWLLFNRKTKGMKINARGEKTHENSCALAI